MIAVRLPVVYSDDMPSPSLYRVFERDIAPRLRAVDGVVEVNAWGGALPQVDVVVDPYALVARGLTWTDVEEALEGALAITSAGDVQRGSERTSVRAIANPGDIAELEDLVVRQDADGLVRLGDIARVEEAGSITVGLGTADGDSEVIFAMVQLLAGADARSVVDEVHTTVDEVRLALPDGVRLEPVYDRSKLVDNTLSTVSHSLVEGGLLVIVVLLLLLGDVRAGAIVASVIPLSMLGAFTGLSTLGYSGNLMSLGAIDFGLVVDGTIVVVEGIVALHLVEGEDRRAAITERTQSLARPVLFAVGILILVYLPVLGMVGTEGKLFRPMALTVLLALGTALWLSFTYVPALASLVVTPRGHHETILLRWAKRAYQPLAHRLLDRPALAGGLAVAGVGLSALLGLTLGVEFVPRLEEGDLVIQTARLPSISPLEARRESSRIERIVRSFPEVERIASRTGSPALATDPMGLEEADILVQLRPRDEWTTAHTLDGLVTALSERLEAEAPGPEYTFTQPIEMRFNELLEGVTSDVGVRIHGPDLDTLVSLGSQVAQALDSIEGAADVKAPAVDGMPGVDMTVRPGDLARLGATSQDLHGLVAGVRRGVEVGTLVRGAYRDPVVMKAGLPMGVDWSDLPFAIDGGYATLGDVGGVDEVVRPAVIRRQSGSRRVLVQANVRGRDLGSFVQEARARVGEVDLPDGYWVVWSGAYEQLQAAAWRTALTVPLVLGLIGLVLYAAFGAWRPALLIFLNVPAAASGGVVALFLRDLPISMSAIVGFIALFGVAVMNGIVLLSRTTALHGGEVDARQAALMSASERFRPVLMTALVAGIGFLPMALATGVGAEVQRPLATVVIGGLCTSTPLTLLVLPALYARFGRRDRSTAATDR